MASKVLVTGATGFIGRRLVDRLAKSGARVRALVLPDERCAMAAGVEVVRGDISDPAAVDAAMAGVRRVYHLAAVVGDWGHESLFQRVNVEGTRNVLDAATRTPCERVIMVSSIVVHGWHLCTGPCHDSSPRQYGVGPYSRSKRAAEQLALDYHALGRVPVTVVRPGNVYGPRSPLWVDQIVRLLRAGKGLVIDSGEGDAILAYVDNVVDVIARAADTAGAAGRVYHAVDGSGVTWRQYLGDLARIAGTRPRFINLSLPAARTMAAVMERAYRLLGRTERPLLTTEAVVLLASRQSPPIDRAVAELGYRPVSYGDAMDRVAAYVHGGVS
jgi:2-alkyl-3-oxoalkanoate reductase